MDIGPYLQRMGYRGPLQPDLETLRALHLSHLEALPFENLEVLRRRSLLLDEAALFDKLVRGHRGGVRHELNVLFAALLRELGFQVTFLSARVSTAGEWPSTPAFDHLVLEVFLEERWLVDVGHGDAFDEPLPLLPGRWPSAGRVFVLDAGEEEWGLARESSHGLSPWLYAFSREPRRLEEFSARCQFLATSPESPLGHQLHCTRRTPRGRVSLYGDRLLLTEGGQRLARVLGENEELEPLLLSHFGISSGPRGTW